MTTAHPVALPAPGPVPTATATSRYIGVAVAIMLLIGGVIAIREAGLVFGWLDGTSWFRAAVATADGLHRQWWMVPLGSVAVLLGGWLVFAALRPRRKTAVAVDATGSVWMRPRDIARLARHAAGSVPGVEVLSSEATRRKVTLYVGLRDVESPDGAKGAITAAVASATEILLPPPRVAVRIGTSESS